MLNSQDTVMPVSRRQFLGTSAGGIGVAALASLLAPPAACHELSERTHFPARATRMISIFLAGGPAQMELFDYKPQLKDWQGKDLPASVRGDQRLTGFTASQKEFPVVASPFEFHQHGVSGAWISDLLPNLARVVDELCFVKSMHTEAINHDPAVTYLLTGAQQPGRPSIGSWLSYGLGSENENLPAYVVLLNPGEIPGAATPLSARHWGSGFLPSQHQGVRFRAGADPVLYLSNPPGIDGAMRRRMLDLGERLNRMQLDTLGDQEIATRIAQYEMAYRMQSSVPQLTDLSTEPEYIYELYGADARKPGTFAANCLLARRLCESGVRFVQLFDRDWDHHRGAPDFMRQKTQQTDRPLAALITDLKQRGLLDDTLVVCGGEFGRSVYCQGPIGEKYGRDHHGRCYTTWLAGGGIRRATTYGATDEFCYNIVENPVHVHDLNATLLHCLGIDHERLTFKQQGRHFRLTDVEGQVVRGILAT